MCDDEEASISRAPRRVADRQQRGRNTKPPQTELGVCRAQGRAGRGVSGLLQATQGRVPSAFMSQEATRLLLKIPERSSPERNTKGDGKIPEIFKLK